MNRREVVRRVMEHGRPPYVPWSFGFTVEAAERLLGHYALPDLPELKEALGDHLLRLGSETGYFQPAGPTGYKDAFGVIWNRSIDKDIGNVGAAAWPLQPARFRFPDPLDPRISGHPAKIARYSDRFGSSRSAFPVGEGLDPAGPGEHVHRPLDHRVSRRAAGGDRRLELVPGGRALDYDLDGCSSATIGDNSGGCNWACACGGSSCGRRWSACSPR
jgi:uroporphyrinogen decarboxylase